MRSAPILLVLLGASGWACPARAQGLFPTQAGSSGTSAVTADPARPSAESTKVADQSSRLFDQSTTISSLQLELGPVWYRPQAAKREGFERGTGELAVSTVTTALWKPFYLAGAQKLVFRAFDSKSYHASFSSELATGVYLGPLEIESRIGLNVLNLSAFHGDWSGDAFSPRVAVAAGLHVWRIRVDIQAHSEYLWRWFGNDYLVHGVTLGLRLDLPRPDHPLMKKRSSSR